MPLLAPRAVAASESVACRVVTIHFDTRGLQDYMREAARQALVAELQALGCVAVATPELDRRGEGCADDAACVRQVTAQLRADAALDVRLARFGGMVRTRTRFLDGSSGVEVLTITTTVPIEAMPRPASLPEDLRRGFDAVGGACAGLEQLAPPAPQPAPQPAPPVGGTAGTSTGGAPPGDDGERAAAGKTTTWKEPGARPLWIASGGVTSGVGVVVLAAGVATGVVALRDKEALLARCSDGICPSEAQEEGDRIQTQAVAADILAGAGLVIIATGAVLLWVGLGDAEDGG